MTIRLLAFALAILSAGCAQTQLPSPPDIVAANTREQSKLAALADCHLLAQEENNAGWGSPEFRVFVDSCMQSRGYFLRSDLAGSEMPH